MFPRQDKTIAEVEPRCEICGKPIGAGRWSPPWPERGPVLKADFRPYELKFHRPTSDEPAQKDH